MFDLLALVLCFLLGRRVRGPTLGVALAYAWAASPFTLYALESDTNDTLVAVLVLAAMLVATGRREREAARGVLAALAGLTKFAPLALAPLLATHGLSGPLRRRALSVLRFTVAFLACAALVSIPAFTHSSLHTFWEDTLVYQANRGSPFSVWGLYGGLGGLQAAVEVAAVALAVALARRAPAPDVVGLAAAARRHAARPTARRRPLVLPVHPLVRAAGDVRAARALRHRAGPYWGRGISTCSIESARRRVDARTITPISQGSSSEVSKRTGMWSASPRSPVRA